MAHPHWPLFDLEVRTPRLTMRYIDDELGAELATLAAAGIHDPDWMPFAMPWSNLPSPELERQALQFYWRCRVETSPERWNINFAVIVNGAVVGSTGLMSESFAKLRQFETGSWLGREHQGQGIGTEMRIATLQLGFVGFGAEWATTGAWHDNAPSLGVTRKLGYREQGHRRLVRNDEHSDTLIGFEMPHSHFAEHLRRDDIELVGIDAVREQLGIVTSGV
jgi:RimJ/RimL family protein N-acetyltransferase